MCFGGCGGFGRWGGGDCGGFERERERGLSGPSPPLLAQRRSLALRSLALSCARLGATSARAPAAGLRSTLKGGPGASSLLKVPPREIPRREREGRGGRREGEEETRAEFLRFSSLSNVRARPLSPRDHAGRAGARAKSHGFCLLVAVGGGVGGSGGLKGGRGRGQREEGRRRKGAGAIQGQAVLASPAPRLLALNAGLERARGPPCKASKGASVGLSNWGRCGAPSRARARAQGEREGGALPRASPLLACFVPRALFLSLCCSSLAARHRRWSHEVVASLGLCVCVCVSPYEN